MHCVPTQSPRDETKRNETPNPRHIGDHLLAHPVPHPSPMWCSASVLTASVPTASVPTASVPTASVPTASVPTACCPSHCLLPLSPLSAASVPTVCCLCPHCLLPLSPLSASSVPTVCCLCPHCLLPLSSLSAASVPTVCCLCPHCLLPLSPLSAASVPTVCCLCPHCLLSSPLSAVSVPAMLARPRSDQSRSYDLVSWENTTQGYQTASLRRLSPAPVFVFHGSGVLDLEPWSVPACGWLLALCQSWSQLEQGFIGMCADRSGFHGKLRGTQLKTNILW